MLINCRKEIEIVCKMNRENTSNIKSNLLSNFENIETKIKIINLGSHAVILLSLYGYSDGYVIMVQVHTHTVHPYNKHV